MKVTLTPVLKEKIDEAVLVVIRAHGTGIRAAAIEQATLVQVAIKALPRGKEAHRYVGNSLQRLRQAGKPLRRVVGGWHRSEVRPQGEAIFVVQRASLGRC